MEVMQRHIKNKLNKGNNKKSKSYGKKQKRIQN